MKPMPPLVLMGFGALMFVFGLAALLQGVVGDMGRLYLFLGPLWAVSGIMQAFIGYRRWRAGERKP
jgi:hypothetical protein